VATIIVVVAVVDVARAVVPAAVVAAAISNAKLNRRLRFTAQPFLFGTVPHTVTLQITISCEAARTHQSFIEAGID
jgi:hypothetical protein